MLSTSSPGRNRFEAVPAQTHSGLTGPQVRVGHRHLDNAVDGSEETAVRYIKTGPDEQDLVSRGGIVPMGPSTSVLVARPRAPALLDGRRCRHPELL